MKLFIYKSLIIIFLIFVLFHATVGYVLRSYEVKFYNFFSKEKIVFIKQKIREEIQDSLDDEIILNEEDAILLKNFISKITEEINSTK